MGGVRNALATGQPGERETRQSPAGSFPLRWRRDTLQTATQTTRTERGGERIAGGELSPQEIERLLVRQAPSPLEGEQRQRHFTSPHRRRDPEVTQANRDLGHPGPADQRIVSKQLRHEISRVGDGDAFRDEKLCQLPTDRAPVGHPAASSILRRIIGSEAVNLDRGQRTLRLAP